jgi:dTDP-4-dehydrorhamnose reductase
VTRISAENSGKPALWGGPECTVCRIGDQWRDQARETGHFGRLEDLDRIAALGIRTVRYPLLWEHAAQGSTSEYDFTIADRQLGRLRSLGVDVIAGLVHHGSGPAGTSLLDPQFADKLAHFAAAAAERYPWISQWTPVNEPLTTARFSALYGHWYPHHKRFDSFAAALVNQCLGTLRAMAAIRRFIPAATLVQTEDIGRTFATPSLSRQADHDNRRSWLSLDLLFGRVAPGHPFYRRLRNAGIVVELLEELQSGAGRPDIVGVNHYLTSDRFLDQRADRYPGEHVGGNGRQRYVDVEAVRVAHLAGEVGIEPRLREVWERYHAPIAITEVHHGCTHDEQLRWLMEVWNCATRLKGEGIDIRAVTLWAMFGNVDWRSLLTRDDGHYDPGVFDARATPPRPTVLAKAATALAAGRDFDHPVLASPGWWHRSNRFYGTRHEEAEPLPGGAPHLIVGATGTLGSALARVARSRGLAMHATRRSDLDLGDPATIRDAIDRIKPWAIVNAAGFVRVADAEHDRDGCFAANAGGVEHLAHIAAEFDLPLVGVSTDLVFDGTKGAYAEGDACHPRSVYGESKLAAEQALFGADPRNLVIRTAAFFGPWDFHNFAWHTLQSLKRRERVEIRGDVRVSPTYVPDLCHALLDLLIDGEGGLWHLANAGSLSWYEFALKLAQAAGIDSSGLVATSGEASDTSLVSTHGAMLRPVEAAIDDYCRRLAGIEQDFATRHAAATP